MPEPIPATPAPAAPAAAPTPSHSPATAPSPAAGGTPAAAPPSPPPATAAGDDNPYNDVDAAFTKAGMPDPDKAKPAPKDAPPSKDGKTAAPSKPIPTAADKAPGVPKELRAELDRVKGELKTKETAYAQLEARIAEAETKGKDTAVLTERLTALEKQMNDKDAELRALKQEASPEFKQKYDVPFNRLADRAKTVIEQIQIEDAEGGPVRQATWGEFTKLYQQGEFIATKEAKRLFGEDGAAVAMRYYTELHRLDDDRAIALAEEKKNWKERETAQQAQIVQSQEQINDFWSKSNAALAEKVEDYHDSPDDKELSAARTKALSIYDAQPKTLKDRIIKDAHNRQRVAAFPVLKMKLARALKELEEIKTENEGLKENPPGRGSRPGGSSDTPHAETLEEALRKIQ